MSKEDMDGSPEQTKISSREGLKKMMGSKIIRSDSLIDLPGVRSLQLNGLHVSVLERDVEPGPGGDKRYDYNIIVDVLPGCDMKAADLNIRRVLVEMFNTPDCIECIYQDQNAIRRKLGAPLQDFNNFFVGIQWPRASLYSLDKIKELFVKKLAAHYG